MFNSVVSPFHDWLRNWFLSTNCCKKTKSQVHEDTKFDIDDNNANAAKLSLRLQLPDKQLVIMCDTSERAAESVFLIRIMRDSDDGTMKSNNQLLSDRKDSPKVRCHSQCTQRCFWPGTSRLANSRTFCRGVKKPTVVMTDNKSLTRLLQSKRIPPKLCNYCDQALKFDFVLAQVPGVKNPAAVFLSRIDINSRDRINL